MPRADRNSISTSPPTCPASQHTQAGILIKKAFILRWENVSGARLPLADEMSSYIFCLCLGVGIIECDFEKANTMRHDTIRKRSVNRILFTAPRHSCRKYDYIVGLGSERR